MSDSRARRILEEIVIRIKALSLSGITSTNIVALKGAVTAEALAHCLPGKPGIVAMIVDAESIDQLGPSPVEYDDIGYPVLIGFIDCQMTEDQDDSDDRERYWRELVRRNFIRQRLVETTTAAVLAYTCTVEHRASVNAAVLKGPSKLWASSLVLRFHAREARI